MTLSAINNISLVSDLSIEFDFIQGALPSSIQHVNQVKTLDDEALKTLATSDLILISLHMLRKPESSVFAKALINIDKIGIACSEPTQDEVDTLEPFRFNSFFTLQEFTSRISETLTEDKEASHIYDLSILLEMGLTKEEAKNTVKQAVPRMYELIDDLKDNLNDLTIENAITHVHGIHGVTNYCALKRAKQKINRFELYLKELSPQDKELSSADRKTLITLLAETIEDITYLEKELD